MGFSFFSDTGEHNDVDFDLGKFEELLAEYAGTYKKKKMVARMKEIYRNRALLTDFLDRIKIDLRYLIKLTYNWDHRILTPQLAKELNKHITKHPNYPYYWSV